MRAFIRQVQRPTQFFRLGAMPKLGTAGRRHVNTRHGGTALGHGTRTMASLGALVALSIFIMGADQIPLPEHPRPDLRRDAWVNLNGAWDFEFDANDVGREQKWFDAGAHEFSRRINVPFPWESKLSGIADPAYRGVAWYARQVTIPADWQGKDAWIVFGAVDFEATVWANGWRVASHVGGYTPFAAKLSGIARPGDTVSIVVRARDVTDREQPTGKQVGWYTRTSGIWQTVYLEARGSAYVNRLRIVASLAKKQAKFTVAVAGRAHSVVVETAGVTQRTRTGRNREVTLTVPIDNPRAWHPDDPQLYDATVTVLDDDGKAIDRVQTYFGLRDIGVAQAAGRSYKYITLNGKPLYLRGALHQSFHPDGIYQYPSDALLKHDYVYAKKIGLNFFRIHIKAEIPRALYWADRLGVLIMQDMPNPWRQTEQARIWYEAMLREVIERDFNHPSIFSWCDFNETWGLGRPREFKEDKDTQQWVRRMYELTKQLDPTRLAEDNSPCNYDHVATDINSWHFYINDYARAREHIAGVVDQTKPGSGFNYCPGLAQSDAPLINSEYGGISAGLGDQDISWCFKFLTNELRRHDKICGYIYTEQSDIEWEHNGFLNYDRSEKEFGYDFWFPGFGLADINAADFVVLDVPPCQTVKPGQTVEVPVSISHWSSRSDGALLLKWSLRAHNGLRFETAASGQQSARWAPHRVVRQIPLRVTLPATPVVAALNVEVVNRAGQRIAANYVNFHVYESPAPRVQVVADKTVALRFRPSDMAQWAFSDDSMPLTSGIAADKAAGRGAGVAVYEIQIPENIPLAELEKVTFLGELSARAGDEKLAWPARKRATDYPQSDGTKWPSTVRISLNGATTDVHLPDDPADARGVLSHHYRYQPGSYGYPIMADVPTGSDALRQIARDRRISVRLEVPTDAEHVGGLAIYGERLGRYPLDPTILLTFKEPHGLPSDYRTDETVAVDRLTARRETVLPTAEQRGAVWRYTTTEPDRTWRQPDFDDTAWKRGRGGFGTQGTPNAHIGTAWDTPAIWLRTTFDLSSTSDIAAVLLRFYHDEDILVAINGQRVLRRAGYEPEYVEHALSDVARRALRQGKNVIAVRCRQTGGGQAIDVGVDIIRRAN